ncbi:MAG: FeoA domain-containing protein [Planctomycetota bacterium]
MTQLGKLAMGDRVEVLAVDGEGTLVSRLSALGFLPGKIVEIIHIAPLRDPITVRLDQQELSVRRADANAVYVRRLAKAV